MAPNVTQAFDHDLKQLTRETIRGNLRVRNHLYIDPRYG
jgi:hypothetical protein